MDIFYLRDGCHHRIFMRPMAESLSYFVLLVASGYYHTALGRFAAYHVDTGSLLVCKRHAAYRGLGVFLDFSLGLGRAVPVAKEETAVLHFLLEFLVVVALIHALVTILARFFEYVLLYVIEQLTGIFHDTVQ